MEKVNGGKKLSCTLVCVNTAPLGSHRITGDPPHNPDSVKNLYLSAINLKSLNSMIIHLLDGRHDNMLHRLLHHHYGLDVF